MSPHNTDHNNDHNAGHNAEVTTFPIFEKLYECEHIATGFYGDVYRTKGVKSIKDNSTESGEFAPLKKTKIIKIWNINNDLDNTKTLEWEAENLRNHAIQAVFVQQECFPQACLIMGDCGQSLPEFLKENPGLTMLERISLILSLCNEIVLLQFHGMIHRDLKPENICVKRLTKSDGPTSYQVIVVDFGIAVNKNNVNKDIKIIGTKIYMPPEILNIKSYDYSIDIYALSAIIGYILTSDIDSIISKKFINFSNDQEVYNTPYDFSCIKNNTLIKSVFNDKILKRIFDFLNEMQNYNPRKRKNIKEIKDFFMGLASILILLKDFKNKYDNHNKNYDFLMASNCIYFLHDIKNRIENKNLSNWSSIRNIIASIKELLENNTSKEEKFNSIQAKIENYKEENNIIFNFFSKVPEEKEIEKLVNTCEQAIEFVLSLSPTDLLEQQSKFSVKP